MTNIATVENQNPKVAPTLTLGRMTPEVLHQWERACKEYFRVRHVTVGKQVESVLSQLQDLHIADWAEVNESDLVALKFPEFMTRLRNEFLKRDWDRKIKLSMLASKQGERPFAEWAYEVQTHNTLLHGRPYHFSDEALRETLENNMDPGLKLRIRRMAKDVESPTPLRDWIETVKAEDEYVVRERKEVKEMVKEMAKRMYVEQKGPELRTMKNPGSGRPLGSKGPGGSTSTATGQQPPSSSVLPKLTPVERSLLFEHQGCFKCRKLYVDHKGADCPNGFPALGSYRPLTAELAEAVIVTVAYTTIARLFFFILLSPTLHSHSWILSPFLSYLFT